MNEDELLDLLRRCASFLNEHKQAESANLRYDIAKALDDRWIPRGPAVPWGRPP